MLTAKVDLQQIRKSVLRSQMLALESQAQAIYYLGTEHRAGIDLAVVFDVRPGLGSVRVDLLAAVDLLGGVDRVVRVDRIDLDRRVAPARTHTFEGAPAAGHEARRHEERRSAAHHSLVKLTMFKDHERHPNVLRSVFE